MLLRRVLPAARQNLAHSFPIMRWVLVCSSPAHAPFELSGRHLINGRGLRGCRFLDWVRRDEEAYPQRSTTEEQCHPSRKATPSLGQEHFAASGRVARFLQTHGVCASLAPRQPPRTALAQPLLFMRWLLG